MGTSRPTFQGDWRSLEPTGIDQLATYNSLQWSIHGPISYRSKTDGDFGPKSHIDAPSEGIAFGGL